MSLCKLLNNYKLNSLIYKMAIYYSLRGCTKPKKLYTHTHTHIKYTNRDLVRRRGSKNESNYGIYSKVLPGSTVVKKLLPIQETQKIRVWSLDQEETLEREMATHYSILAWRIPWTEEPGRLQNMGLQRVGHDSVTTHAHYWYICYTLIVHLLHTLHCLSFKY